MRSATASLTSRAVTSSRSGQPRAHEYRGRRLGRAATCCRHARTRQANRASPEGSHRPPTERHPGAAGPVLRVDQLGQRGPRELVRASSRSAPRLPGSRTRSVPSPIADQHRVAGPVGHSLNCRLASLDSAEAAASCRNSPASRATSASTIAVAATMIHRLESGCPPATRISVARRGPRRRRRWPRRPGSRARAARPGGPGPARPGGASAAGIAPSTHTPSQPGQPAPPSPGTELFARAPTARKSPAVVSSSAPAGYEGPPARTGREQETRPAAARR